MKGGKKPENNKNEGKVKTDDDYVPLRLAADSLPHPSNQTELPVPTPILTITDASTVSTFGTTLEKDSDDCGRRNAEKLHGRSPRHSPHHKPRRLSKEKKNTTAPRSWRSTSRAGGNVVATVGSLCGIGGADGIDMVAAARVLATPTDQELLQALATLPTASDDDHQNAGMATSSVERFVLLQQQQQSSFRGTQPSYSQDSRRRDDRRALDYANEANTSARPGEDTDNDNDAAAALFDEELLAYAATSNEMNRHQTFYYEYSCWQNPCGARREAKTKCRQEPCPPAAVVLTSPKMAMNLEAEKWQHRPTTADDEASVTNNTLSTTASWSLNDSIHRDSGVDVAEKAPRTTDSAKRGKKGNKDNAADVDVAEPVPVVTPTLRLESDHATASTTKKRSDTEDFDRGCCSIVSELGSLLTAGEDDLYDDSFDDDDDDDEEEGDFGSIIIDHSAAAEDASLDDHSEEEEQSAGAGDDLLYNYSSSSHDDSTTSRLWYYREQQGGQESEGEAFFSPSGAMPVRNLEDEGVGEGLPPHGALLPSQPQYPSTFYGGRQQRLPSAFHQDPTRYQFRPIRHHSY